MKPSQQQTVPEEGGNITPATKARQVESWLAGLPIGDPLETARALTEYLAAHDRPEVAAGLRKQALDILARVLQRPDFAAAVVKREKQRLVAAIREAEADPGTVVDKAFHRALYGTHPYAHDEAGGFAAGEAYLPEGMARQRWYQPTERGLESRIRERLDELRRLSLATRAAARRAEGGISNSGE